MKKVRKLFIKDLNAHIGETVTLLGWVYNKRSSGSIHFLQFRDGSGFIQAVAAKGEVTEDAFKKCEEITIESSVEIKGLVREEKRAPSGIELTLLDLEIIQLSDEFPISKVQEGHQHGVEFLFDNRHLHIRSQRQWAILRIRNTIINAVYENLHEQGFIKFDSPIFTPNACEGTTTLFEVPYTPSWKEGATTGESVFLTQSGQLYLEAAIASFGRVFDFGPVFRAEKSKTRRHLNEFWMMDAEAAFVEHEENMQIQEELTVAIVKKVLEDNRQELEILGRDISKLEPVLNGKFERITHIEAIKMLQKEGSDIKDRDDLGADDETTLTMKFDKPIFIERYPLEVKAFYMKVDPNDKTRALNNDLLAPEGYGEIIGGSQREDSFEILLERMKHENLPLSEFQWYLDLRKYGAVPHSGFGIGLERYVRWLCGIQHVRETIPFPRLINRIKP